MIPKIIHYCWFGRNPLPELAERCIASWRKFLPDYEIWQWGEESPTPALPRREGEDGLFDRVMLFDVNIIPYTAEAYRQKKYAFVSDYARFWILYRYGGIYFDTDVEVIRPMEEIIAKGNFMGFEVDPDGKNTPGHYAPRYCFDVALGLGVGIAKGHPFMQKMQNLYNGMVFGDVAMSPWLKTIVAYTTEALVEEGLKNQKGIQQVGDITIYPHEYFAPIDVITRRLHITTNTYSIHHYLGSWNSSSGKSWKEKIRNILPEWVFYLNNRIKRRRYRINSETV